MRNFPWNLQQNFLQVSQTLTHAARRHQEYLDQICYQYEVQFTVQLEMRVSVGPVERWGCWKFFSRRLVHARWILVTLYKQDVPLGLLDRSYIRRYEVFQYTYNAAEERRSIVNERRNYTAKWDSSGGIKVAAGGQGHGHFFPLDTLCWLPRSPRPFLSLSCLAKSWNDK